MPLPLTTEPEVPEANPQSVNPSSNDPFSSASEEVQVTTSSSPVPETTGSSGAVRRRRKGAHDCNIVNRRIEGSKGQTETM